MQLEPPEQITSPPGEQVRDVALELALAAAVIFGLTGGGPMPRTALVALAAVANSLQVASEQLNSLGAALLAKPPRPAPAAAPPPRPHKKPAKPVAAAKPQRSNGATPASPAAPEPPAKPVP